MQNNDYLLVFQGGVPKKHWDVLRREVVHTYGHEHILTLAALQDAGETLQHLAAPMQMTLCRFADPMSTC